MLTAFHASLCDIFVHKRSSLSFDDRDGCDSNLVLLACKLNIVIRCTQTRLIIDATSHVKQGDMFGLQLTIDY